MGNYPSMYNPKRKTKVIAWVEFKSGNIYTEFSLTDLYASL